MSKATGRTSWRGIGTASTNVVLAAVFFFFAVANLHSFVGNPRLSVALIVITETIVAVLFLIRKDADETKHSWQTWVSTTIGTLAPMFLRPSAAVEDLLIGQVIQVAGFGLQIAAILSLNRSFGLLPAHRSVKSDGLYSLVRHPLYTAYTVSFIGYLINNLNVYNATVIVVGTMFQVWRIRCEEDLLLKYPNYASYAHRTRWRLMPSIW
ncbi:MAG: methyltransferase family protein [Gammaproteobacteria bacterium]